MSQYEDVASTTYPDEEDREAKWMESNDIEEYDEESDEDKISIGNLADDITEMAVKKYGMDIQGILFENTVCGSRDICRQMRVKDYEDVQDVRNSGRDSKKESISTEKDQVYYEFQYNTRSVKMNIPHFQLRNLVWATTKHDVYLMGNFSVVHWSALTFDKREVIDLMGPVIPSEAHYNSLVDGFFKPEVCTMTVKDNVLLAGGMKGEIICKLLDREGVTYCSISTPNVDGCTQFLELFENPSGSVHFLAASNDSQVRDFDVEHFVISNNLSFPFIVNHTSLRSDGKLAVIVGDSTDGLVVDPNSGQTVHRLRGHLDYSFASAWNPDNQTFATGNQDKTCRIWDIRNLSKSVVVLHGNIGAIRSIRYTSDGKFMAMAESADFLHIFDVGSGYRREQEVDFFGEVGGISFSPEGEALFVGLDDLLCNSLIEFRRQQQSFSYLNTIL